MRKAQAMKSYPYYFFLFILTGVVLTGCAKPAAHIATDENLVTINVGRHSLVAEETGYLTETFLIMGGFTPDSETMAFFTANFLAIPNDQAQRLISKYGDISRCKTRGAAEAQRLSRPITFFAENAEVKEIILKTVQLANGSAWPAIEISGVELKIVEHKYGEMNFSMSGMGTYYLINEINILE